VPLLSLGASVLLLVIIFIGDGIGADGARNALLFVPAGENRVSLIQEQMVRTRLLLKRTFELPETVAASYIQQGNEPFSGRSSSAGSLMREGKQMSGDWFRTRTVQGLFLRHTIPSRGEVVLRQGATPEAAPQLLSTMAGTLRHVFYVDAAGKYWQADELITGRPATLKPAEESEYRSWVTDASVTFSNGLREQWRQAAGRRGYFYAQADPVAENTIATLSSITWSQQAVVCLGPCTPEAAP
jgi:hypothetical protein